MSTAKRGLGRGLSALIPDTPKVPESSVFMGGRTIVNLDLEVIVPNPRQPRSQMDSTTLEELANSIRQEGVIQPILVRPRDGTFELIAGERRWQAARLAGLTKIPAIVKEFSDREAMELSLIENLQREDLNPLDEAEGYARLQSDFGLTQDQLAERIGKHRSTIANALRLLELPQIIRDSLRQGEITAGHARALLAFQNADQQIAAWQEVLQKKLSVREVELLGPIKTKRSKRASAKRLTKHAELIPIEEELTTHLGTRVSIVGKPERGRIVIDYFSREDLDRVLELLLARKTAETVD